MLTYLIIASCQWERRESLTTAYYIEMQILTTFRNAASCFLSLAPCTNAETCTSCVTQLDRFQERQRISWKSVDVPLRRRSINERCFTIRQNYALAFIGNRL